MKRKITFLSAALMLLAFLAVPLGMRGQTEVSWTASEQGYANAADVTDITIDDNIAGTFAKASGSNAPKYYTTGEAVRMYNGNTLTITPGSECEITEIAFTLSQSGGFTVSDGEYSVESLIGTWTGSSTEPIVFTNGSSQNRIQVITVTYTAGGTPAVTHTLTFSANPTDGGTVTVGNTTLAEGATTSISATANAGYVFGSWTVTGEGSSVNDAGDTFTMGTEDATLTANFTAVTTYTVTYHANVTGIDDIEVVYNEGEDVTVAANTFSNPGFAFSEWNTQADGDGDPYVAGDVIENIQADIDLYAQWEESSEVTATLNIESYATAHSWSNGTQYLTAIDDQVTFTAAGGSNTGKYYTSGQDWRYYQGESATITISVPDGYHLVSITPTYNTSNGGVLLNGSATIQSGSTVDVSGTSVTFSVGNSGSASNGQVRFTNIDVTYASDGGVLPPSISAGNVEISYETISGSIAYTINNEPDPAGTISAEVTDGDWLTLGETPITFTCTVNEAATDRTATVLLTYTYGDNQTVTKEVTVTQLGNPIVTPTIAEVRAQGTGSSVVTRGIVTSITGSNNKTAYIQDTTAAIVVYGNFTAAMGDEIRVSGSLSNYNGLLEITTPQVTIISSGNTIEPQLMTVAEAVASENQGWYIRIENAIVSAISGQNTTIAQGESTIVVRGISGVEIAENDVISLNGNIGYYNGNQIANPQNVEVQVAPAEPSITLSSYSIEVTAEEAEGTLDITYENLTITEANDFEIQYYNAQGEEIEQPNWISASVNEKELSKDDATYYEVTYVIAANNGEARTAYFKVSAVDAENNTVYSNLVTVNQEAYVAPVPSITITPDVVNLDAGEHYVNLLDLAYENIEVEGTDSFTVHYYNAEGEEIELVQGEAWLIAGVVLEDDVYQVLYAVVANYGEARTAYFKVSCGETYSNLVTVTQAAPVLDYAVLPFVWAGGSSADFAALNGVTLSGNGSDYNSNHAPYLIKFDGTGDYIQVKTNGQPGLVTIGVKMIGGSNTSTITIQGSADGETFTDIEELTISGAQNDTLTLETTNAFDANDRYVRMLFTKGSNVGVGPITIAQGTAPSINIAPANFDLEAVGDLNGMQVASGFVTYNNIDITQDSDFHIQFYNAEGVEQNQPEWILGAAVSQIANSYQVACMVGPNTGAARSTYYKVYAFDADSNPVYSNLVTINQAGVPQPSITITPDNFELDANSHMAEVLAPITYQNIVVVSGSGNETFDVQYYDAEGHEIEQTWCSVGAAANGDTDFNLIIVAGVNEGNEARTAYFKLYGLDEEANLVYSNLVTVTQAAPVIDYAVLPFVWEGGSSADFAALNGVTLSGNGSDYNSNHAPYLIKLDGTGDYIQVKTDSQPGTVTIGVKMIGGSNTSTITIQGSADGETFTDIEVLTISGAQNDTLTLETTNAFADADRYVRMLFTKGSNVGVGPITIASGSASSITVTPATLNLEATGTGQNGVQMQQFVVTYHNLDIESHDDFAVQFYDAEGEEQEQPTWITPNPAYVAGGNEEGYMMMLFIEGNTGVARSAYLKVYALGEEDYVYSNLVTINQAGAPQQYTLTVEPFENLELITFVNDEMVMEADGEIQVNEGDHIMLSIVADEGYDMETLMVNGVNHVNDIADDFTYEFDMPAEAVTISATAIEHVVPTPGEWVITSLNDLTENDVFVIVGVYDVDESSFAMPNNSTSAPSAVEVTMVGNTLSGDIDDNLKWNLSIGEDGYTFYPNGETETWLYCTNTNNGVRVGTNENNVFSMTTEGYLFNNATDRYIGIYNHQDWRCYTSINNNIKNQTFAFFKRVDESEIETYTLDVTGYGDNEGGYYLIASPVSMIRPTAENGFLTDEYDLYYFDQAQQGEEWRNYKAKKFFPASGKGYLYASQESTMLIFTGVPYNGNGEVALDYTEGASFAGWNLIGNPFGNAATIDKAYYRLNADGSEVNATTESSAIAAMEGVFVVAETVGETVTFTEQTNPNNNNEVSQICINVSMNRGESIDRAIVRFDNGNQLPKFQLNPNHTKVYFPQGENDYAIVRSANEGEMPVNFKAENNGTYTISINTENVEMNYLHLIDNMTGTDVDLLANPSYSFEAKTTDYANRFRLVFNANTVNENGNETFAYFNGSEWVISNMGEATLQVVDLMGRVLSTETVNGNATMNLNQTPGVYMLRLVNGDSVKVQKVVVR